MGFPIWTLWGMAIAAGGALICVSFAYVAQSPTLLQRFRLTRTRLPARARSLTGFTLAFLLAGIGFFAAGVPVGGELEPGAPPSASNSEGTSAATNSTDGALSNEGLGEDESLAIAAADGGGEASTAIITEEDVANLTPESGAFARPVATETPAPSTPTAIAEVVETATATATATARATNTRAPTQTATATATATATGTATATPTATPTATQTPTRIAGPTVRVNATSSTLWVRRTPGGQQTALVLNGDILLVENGRANQGGQLWQKVRTVDGVLGWVQLRFLDFGLDSTDEG